MRQLLEEIHQTAVTKEMEQRDHDARPKAAAEKVLGGEFEKVRSPTFSFK
jgi:hypothetical protein